MSSGVVSPGEFSHSIDQATVPAIRLPGLLVERGVAGLEWFKALTGLGSRLDDPRISGRPVDRGDRLRFDGHFRPARLFDSKTPVFQFNI